MKFFKKIFNSQNYLSAKTKKCFEGWYFKITLGGEIFAFIVGVCKNKTENHSFMQYIDKNSSHYFKFSYEDFSFNKTDMTVRIANNAFSLKGVDVKIDDGKTNICCCLNFDKVDKFKKSVYAPSAMGPFSYIPFFCSHAVVALNIEVSGQLIKDGKIMAEGSGNGYIEKDYGNSFPKNYVWTHAQSPQFENGTSIVFALAYPLIFNMKGFICILYHEGKQYNLSLYNFAKLSYRMEKSSFSFSLKKRAIEVEAKINFNNDYAKSLAAPADNKMSETIYENVNTQTELLIKKGKKTFALNLPSAFEHVFN